MVYDSSQQLSNWFRSVSKPFLSSALNDVASKSSTQDPDVNTKAFEFQALQRLHPRSTCTVSSQSSTDFHRPKARYAGSSCSEKFCSWLGTADLGRCYPINQAKYHETGEVQYLNKSIYDFKKDAPFECRLCLPCKDHEGIERHCWNVEFREDRLFEAILGLLMGMLVTALLGILIVRRRKRKGQHHGERKEYKARRTPVMPTAAAFHCHQSRLMEKLPVRNAWKLSNV